MQPTSDNHDGRHPAAYRLDAVAAGDEDTLVSEHVASCEECSGYVSALQQEARRFRDRRDPSKAYGFVTHALQRVQRARRRAKAAGVAAPLLAAAAFLLVLRGRSLQETVFQGAQTVAPAQSGEMRFKGELSVAVIRERDGRQERIIGPFGVRAADGIRVEVSVERAAPVTAGLLTDDGDWVVLLAPIAFGAGTHFSEHAARFDDTPTRATLLVGSPVAVERARRTRDFAGLVAWRVTRER